MPNEFNPKMKSDQPVVYQVRIQGHLGQEWTDWFGNVAITLEENGSTLLTGPIVDQAALYGLLKKVRDLGMPLLSLNCVEPSQADESEVKIQKLSKSLEKERDDERANNDAECG